MLIHTTRINTSINTKLDKERGRKRHSLPGGNMIAAVSLLRLSSRLDCRGALEGEIRVPCGLRGLLSCWSGSAGWEEQQYTAEQRGGCCSVRWLGMLPSAAAVEERSDLAAICWTGSCKGGRSDLQVEEEMQQQGGSAWGCCARGRCAGDWPGPWLRQRAGAA